MKGKARKTVNMCTLKEFGLALFLNAVIPPKEQLDLFEWINHRKSSGNLWGFFEWN